MSSYLRHREEASVSVAEATVQDGVTYYCVQVRVGACRWSVRRRFRDFAELHERLVCDHGLPRDKLPPKKIIGNKSSKFIEQRREALHDYATWTLNHLRLATPAVLARFLDLHRYDIFFLLQTLAERLFAEGDTVLQSGEPYKSNPLELHAISERLKMPCPATEKQDRAFDFSHVLDVFGRLTSLHVEGSYDPMGTSNIVPNDLSFDLTCFKSLQHLSMLGVPLARIQSVGGLRDTLESISVQVAGATSLHEWLLVDVVHKEPASVGDAVKWNRLQSIDLSSNEVESIDWSHSLAPQLSTLALGCNRLETVGDISALHRLTELILPLNKISACDGWHERMGNVRCIDLSQNRVSSLSGFSRLYSLESLNLSCNHIADIEEVQHICRLPCLEQLWLTANPVASCVDYRVRVLEQFAQRARDITLDNERASEKELDTARVLQALRIVKEGKTPGFLHESDSFNSNS